MIRCNKCGFGHLTFEELQACKSWAEMVADAAAAPLSAPIFPPPPEWPQHCSLCDAMMDSPDDRTQWHGLGNCVEICTHCNGSGAEPMKAEVASSPYPFDALNSRLKRKPNMELRDPEEPQVPLSSPSPTDNFSNIAEAAKALRFLADHNKRDGGEQRFNAEHLFMLADALDRIKSGEWVKVTPETNPTREGRYLVVYRYQGWAAIGAGGEPRVFIADFLPQYGWDCAGLANVEFTYWKEIGPLPSPPEENRDE